MYRIAATVFLCLVSPLAVGSQIKGAVYSPKPGIVCDKKAQFCADSDGISLAYTKQYLGEGAEKTMRDRISSASQVGYDLTWFAFSNGVDCRTKLKRCTIGKNSDKVDAAHTKALFGK